MGEEKIIFDTTPLWEIQDNETRILTEKDYLKKEIKKLKSQLQQKENKIKEVREYIEKIPNEDNSTESQKIAGTYVIRNVILEILDKGE